MASRLPHTIVPVGLRYDAFKAADGSDAGSVFVILDVHHATVSYAFNVYARIGGHNWPIGHITHAAGAGEGPFLMQSDSASDSMPCAPRPASST